MITPVALRKVTILFTLKEPIKISSSPTKLLVPGKLIFAMVKNKKINEYKGIIEASPP